MIRYALVLVLMLSFALPPIAAPQVTDDYPMTPTIGALRACVQHAFDMGHVTNTGVSRSLLAELKAAQSALDRSQPRVAIVLLQCSPFDRITRWCAGSRGARPQDS